LHSSKGQALVVLPAALAVVQQQAVLLRVQP
jgi:hypothetical protein